MRPLLPSRWAAVVSLRSRVLHHSGTGHALPPKGGRERREKEASKTNRHSPSFLVALLFSSLFFFRSMSPTLRQLQLNMLTFPHPSSLPHKSRRHETHRLKSDPLLPTSAPDPHPPLSGALSQRHAARRPPAGVPDHAVPAGRQHHPVDALHHLHCPWHVVQGDALCQGGVDGRPAGTPGRIVCMLSLYNKDLTRQPLQTPAGCCKFQKVPKYRHRRWPPPAAGADRRGAPLTLALIVDPCIIIIIANTRINAATSTFPSRTPLPGGSPPPSAAAAAPRFTAPPRPAGCLAAPPRP